MLALLDFLFPPRSDEKILRDTALDDFLALIAPSLVTETRPGTVALLSFSDSRVRAALHEAKYHGNERAFMYLGAALADFLPDYMTDFSLAHVGRQTSNMYIVPVPLGKIRQKERGFNQVHEVAKHALRNLSDEVRLPEGSLTSAFVLDTKLLIRTRETPTQVALQRAERERNMRGAFKATRRVDPAHLYIILDDVITTGATLQSAVDALRSYGAEHIIPVALAH